MGTNNAITNLTKMQPRFDRGYTGHEMLCGFGLINMNGRVYDPYVQRFLSADNFIQSPDDAQSYNRYSYCFNNPLKYTDPSGDWINLLYAGLSAGFTNWISHGGQFDKDGLKYFGVGFIAGSVGFGIGSGVNAALAGDKFAQGFVGNGNANKGFCSGFVSGFSGGGAASFITGFGNAWADNKSFNEMINSGVTFGLIGGFSAGIIGGLAGGRDAKKHDKNYWTGSSKQEGVVQIETNGLGRFIDIESYNALSPDEQASYITQLNANQNVSIINGTVTVQNPDVVDRLTTFQETSAAPIYNTYILKRNSISATYLNPPSSLTILGWRWRSSKNHYQPYRKYPVLLSQRLLEEQSFINRRLRRRV